MRVLKVYIYEDATPFYQTSPDYVLEALLPELQEASIGEKIVIEIVDMDEKTYKELPDWDGP
jgi:hypothetical protein